MNDRVEELGKKILNFSHLNSVFSPEIIMAIGDPSRCHSVKVLDFLLSNSEICRILYKNPADFEMLERVYFGKSIRTGTNSVIDTWLSDSLPGQALRNRLQVVSDWVAQWLAKNMEDERKIKVSDLGAGPGAYAFETILKLKKDRSEDCYSRLLWECLDLDRLSLAIGEIRAKENSVEEIVKFRHANFISSQSFPSIEEEKADMALLIGILCGMTPEDAKNCLIKIRPHCKMGGELLAATLLVKSFEEEPLVFRVLCNVLGWQLQPKTTTEVKEIFIAAGYQILSIYSERKDGDGEYAIVHAKLR